MIDASGKINKWGKRNGRIGSGKWCKRYGTILSGHVNVVGEMRQAVEFRIRGILGDEWKQDGLYRRNSSTRFQIGRTVLGNTSLVRPGAAPAWGPG